MAFSGFSEGRFGMFSFSLAPGDVGAEGALCEVVFEGLFLAHN